MSILSEIFAGGAESLVKTVGEVVDQCTTTKEEKLQFELELSKSEKAHQLEMAKLNIEEKKMMYEETDSARNRDVQIQSSAHSTGLSKNTGPLLALGTTLLTFTLFMIVIFYEKIFGQNTLQSNTKDIIIYILGVLSAIVTQIFSFYFGSSQGSADKTEIMRHLQAK